MCAIVGSVSTSSRGESGRAVIRERLARATDALAHRGPDGAGIRVDERRRASGAFGLGHRRLAVNGGPLATQPIRNHDGTLAIVVNGELYDPDDTLRRRLEGLGHRFRTSGDSELALHLYAQYGLEFVHHLQGEFGILLYDLVADRMVAVRDRFGIKPLLYTRHDGEVWFASQARAFAAAGITLEIDLDSVWHTMHFQYTLPDRTMHRNVLQLRPGCLAITDGDDIELRQYWDLDYPPLDDRVGCAAVEDQQETVDDFADRLDQAVRMRMRGDVPVVSHLSGGIDSCSVLESAVRQGGARAAFSIGFAGRSNYDETRMAGEMAARAGVDFHVVDGSPQTLITALEQSVAASEGWTVNGHLPAKFLLSRAISAAGYKVALTGEGADELLAGYGHLKLDYCRKFAPTAVKAIAAANHTSYGTMIPTPQAIDTASIEATLGYVPTFMAAKASQGWMLRGHLRAEFLDSFSGRDAMDEFCAAVIDRKQTEGRHLVHQSLYVWMKTALAQNILRTLGDGCESAHGTEGRLPMLDHQLFEWVKRQPIGCLIRPDDFGSTSIPDHQSAPRFIDKWLLRSAMRRRLPTDICKRPKHPLDAPPLARELLQDRTIRDYVESKIDDHPFFDPAKVRATLAMMHHAGAATQTAVDPLWWMLLCSSKGVF